MKSVKYKAQHVQNGPVSAPSRRFAAPGAGGSDLALDLFLFGSDERLNAGSVAGRTRRAADEVWLSSCHAAAVSPRAYVAARAAYANLVGGQTLRPLPRWFEDLRRRLAALFGAPGCETVLAASDAGAEAVFAALASTALARPVVHIAAATPERGASGLETASFALRDRYGVALPPGQIDAEAARLVAEAIAEGKAVALHVADCSETGLAGPSRSAAAAVAASYPGRALVVVDARQLRASREQIEADLAAGHAVLTSGSTFAGGPIGAAALLLPAEMAERIGRFELPPAFAAHAAAMDWSPRLRDCLRGNFASLADVGLGLRWECALAELEPCFALDSSLRAAIHEAFAREIHRHLAAAPALKLTDYCWPTGVSRSIFPILTFDERGRPIKTEALQRALAEPGARPNCRAGSRSVQVGAPVSVGARTALRLSLSASLLNDVAERLEAGRSFAAATQALTDDLAETFALWTELAAAEADQTPFDSSMWRQDAESFARWDCKQAR